MALSNHEKVGKALELLKTGLGPYVERELTNKIKVPAKSLGSQLLAGDLINSNKSPNDWDASALLKVMWDSWNEVFRATLGYNDRNLVSELRTTRNSWAHQQPFNFDDTYRALDSIERLLSSVSAAKQAQEVAESKGEVLRLRHEEQSRSERKKITTASVEPQGNISLPPWRDVVLPHEDVATGNYQNAEFAADLHQVHVGQGSNEYLDPIEFYKRTYLTESLKGLLTDAIKRIAGNGGDPVIQLQTNFGGGKTHSMLALYHLFSSVDKTKLLGIDEVLTSSRVSSIPEVKRVVLVGTKISAGEPSIKPDGTKVHTLWGEIAYQLGGKEAYDTIAIDDRKATSPGDQLRILMNQYGPCLILIDEWVAYARQLHDGFDLAGGSFDTQFTFAQALTESASAAEKCLLVVSLPASDTSGVSHSNADDIEVGGDRGRAALERLRNAVGRVESTWRPANAEESFEIVRRRLFTPLSSRDQFVSRDKVARAFSELYSSHPNDFPKECRGSEYEKRIVDAYPIHPEVFERLYSDWSTLPKFQRTRGVLRLMAAVIHSLWISENGSPMILPAHMPMDDAQVRSELTRYLSDNWTPVIDKDVDGPNSLPHRLDSEVSSLGRYSASRRVTRTIYLGSAPTVGAANKGIDVTRVRLGSIMPGEPSGIFNDALRRLATSGTYLYQDDSRYWFDTQPTVTKLVEDRAEQLRNSSDKVLEELRRRLKQHVDRSSEFAGIHLLPTSPSDVPDELDTRLVILGPEHYYFRDPNKQSPAEKQVEQILESRGSSLRRFRNTLVFLAPDQARLTDLDGVIRHYLAWISVLSDKEGLNLTPYHVRQAETQKTNADQLVNAQIPETYQWLIAPTQTSPRDAATLSVSKLSGSESLSARAFKKLRNDELLITALGGTRLRKDLDEIPLWKDDSVSLNQLIEYFATYTYLPRVSSPVVICRAIESGVSLLQWRDETFGYAESYNTETGNYLGLRGGENISVSVADRGLLVKPDVAAKQLDAMKATPAEQGHLASPHDSSGLSIPTSPNESATSKDQKKRLRRYHASVEVNPERASDVSRIYNEVLSHLNTADAKGVEVKVTLEIVAIDHDGFPDSVVRTVSENGNSLKFQSHGFEES